MSNPTNAEDYEFAFYFSVKGVKVTGTGDPDTWYPNIQYGLRGVGDAPPPLILQAYLMNVGLNSDPESVRFAILYTDPVSWTAASPEDVAALPGSVEDYSFAIFGDVPADENGNAFRLGLVGSGEYGREVALLTLPIYLDTQGQDGALHNVALCYAPRVSWSAWELDA
ncbi:hypothetical protein SEA_PHAYONCE_23 [Mycobacterium phage Phayonce]|uniref:Uncharacterized protein n=1 Tax=Mycobacterium phage Phayonce TaxID=1647302 RepID=A0A0F6YQ40_9CAUD|nr:hypothetical protein SEA_PHAYONCE_23 [Mycobacterium phage Phayonce]AKF14383.1 hypothetical protein SEA_PHAYONCE_23 [Mycobacterium phage Phayonce]